MTEELTESRSRVLIIEDDANYVYELKEELATPLADLAEFHYAHTFKEAVKKVEELAPDLVLLDIIFPVDEKDRRADRLDYEAGVKLIEHISRNELPAQVVVLSSQSKNFAVNLLVEYRAVLDYIFKDSPWMEIRAKVTRHLESLARQRAALLKFEGTRPIIGRSAAMERVKDLISRVARKDDTTVLITGPSGTGKELVAQHIHLSSRRRPAPLVVVNCAAIPESLLESEFFGYVPGAFTGATRETKGKFEQAHRGTLFLDEIAEIPPSIQVKLLRVLQDKRIQRLGDSQVIEVDVRIIAATNKSLEEEIARGRFREDLYYRVNVFPIAVPALSERREDIAELALYFLEHYNREMEEQKILTPEAQKLMTGYSWPGNVRELKNIIERLIIITDGAQIREGEVRSVLGMSGEAYSVDFPIEEEDYKRVKREVLNAFNRKFLTYHLRRNGYNVLRTAKAISYNRQDLAVLVKELGLDHRSEDDGPEGS